MNSFSKIDKQLLSYVSISSVASFDCVMYVENLELAKKFLKGKNIAYQYYPFINAIALKIERQDIINLSKKSWVNFITKQASVMALMNVAKKVLKVNTDLTGKGVTICYIDTGIKPHADFVIGTNRIIKFLDLINGKENCYDDNGHGTFVAGVGSGNGKLSRGKLKGVAPCSNIVSIKALNGEGEASALKILDAMQWVFDNHKKFNIKVVCMSFGSDPLGYNDPIMKGAEALWDRGITVVAAAGNSGPEPQTIKSPGISPRIITVGGLDDNRIDDENFNKNFFEVANFSSRGPALRKYKPDLIAPAVNINSCSSQQKEFYTKLSGTSVATPMIAGVCALMLEKNNKLSPDLIKHKILNSCQPITYNKNLEGGGLPDFSKIIF